MRTTNDKAVVEVKVEPTDLPVGYRFVGPPAENAFLTASAWELGPLKEIVDRAHEMDARVEAGKVFARVVTTELLIAVLMPRAHFVTQLIAGLGFDRMLEPVYVNR